MNKKYAIPAKAVKILRRVQKAIMEEPLRLDMSEWGESFDREQTSHTMMVGEETTVKQKVPPCGTVACIAGHVLLNSPAAVKELKAEGRFKKLPGGRLEVDFGWGTPEAAQDILGITAAQADKLFYLPWMTFGAEQGWSKKFSDRYTAAKTAKARAKVAVEYIEHFIATGFIATGE